MDIVIVGDGKVGMALTEMLTTETHDVTVIDHNPDVLREMQIKYDAAAILGHGAARPTLLEAGADKADLLIAATSSDEVNLIACIIAKKLGCKQTIARIRSLEYADNISLLREESGLSYSINPDENAAREAFRLLQLPSFLGRGSFAKGRAEIVHFRVSDKTPGINKTVREFNQLIGLNILVCVIDRDSVPFIPDGNAQLHHGDYVYLIAETKDLKLLANKLHLASPLIKQVTLVGGGRLAVYLADMLLDAQLHVKIIEKSEERGQLLADLLPQATIIVGDGTDSDLLDSENIEKSDALVSLMDMDEKNIILSMLGKNMGIPMVITKCNRAQYNDMLREIGLDMLLTPKRTSAEKIARYVRAMESSKGNKMLTLHSIADGKAEAMEFIVDEQFSFIDTSFEKLTMKPGILIGSIVRGQKTIIPTGSTTLQVGDHAIVVSTSEQAISQLEDVFI